MQTTRTTGFSLIEVMVVVTLIGLLTLLAVPGIRQVQHRTEAARTANDLRVFTEAVEFYSSAEGHYPDSMDGRSIPPAISAYLPHVWTDGTYTWTYTKDGANSTYVRFSNLRFTPEQAVRVDTILDDGNIATGDVRAAASGNGLIYFFEGG